MAMTVMEVREVRMAMREPSVAVAMGMWLSRRVVRCVCMLVMRVMDMSVLVLHRLMLVLMLVPLDETQVEADAHEDGCCASRRPTGSESSITASATPMNGAVEK